MSADQIGALVVVAVLVLGAILYGRRSHASATSGGSTAERVNEARKRAEEETEEQ